jgi:MtrB/PioB family decaheme-associated outer membrane protein
MSIEKQVAGTMKKFTRKLGFSIAAFVPVMLMSVQGPVAEAQETEPSIYKCKQCVKYTGWRGILDFGVSYVSDDSLRFGDYRGLDEKGFYAAVDGDVHYRDLEGHYFDLYAYNLGYDSRELDVRGGNQGRYELRFGWQEIPKYRGYGTQTPFLGVGSEALTLPDDWVAANTTSGMTALEGSLVGIPLKTQRKILDLGATVNFLQSWAYRIDYQRQEKKGTRPLGAGLYYSNSTILPAPVDFTTDQVEMALSWSSKRGQIELGYISSIFDNGASSLTWQNPFRSQPQNQAMRAALEPGNKYYQFNLSGALAITPRIRISGHAAKGRMTQDDPFLPYTINPIYSDTPLPRSSLDARVDTATLNASGKLSGRLSKKLSFTARGKWDERDNKTPVDLYTAVVTDLVPSNSRYNRPYSFERQLYSADLAYRAHRVIRISGGGRQQNVDRTLQAVERTKETTWWGEAKVNASLSTQFRFKLEAANRNISDYDQPDQGGPTDHPLMRKFYLADRERERLIIEFDYMPTAEFGINLSYFQADATYDNSEIGLQESQDESYTINLTYLINSKVNLYGFYTHDDIEADILNTTGGSSIPWNALTRDRISTFGAGISAPINEKSSIGFDYISSDSRGDISVQTVLEEDPFDPLRTKLSNAKLYFDHEVNEHWGYKLYAEYEKYSSEDWALDGLGVDGINSVLTMGQQTPDYSIWYFRVQASYRF